jgi:hypothetical protein
MIQLIVLTLILIIFVFFLFKKEEFQVDDETEAEEELVIEEESFGEEEEEESEIEKAINDQIEEINKKIKPVLMLPKKYSDYEPYNETYESVQFKESENNKMTNKIEDIPILPPHKITPFPCRTNQHVWDYTGVHKVAPPSEKCNGIDSAIVPNPLSLIHHPTNYVI